MGAGVDSGPAVPDLLGEGAPHQARERHEGVQHRGAVPAGQVRGDFQQVRDESTTRADTMTYEEIICMTDALRNVNNPYGWSAAKLEWGFTYWLVKDEEGFASKEKIRGVYDGSFFDQVERDIKEGQNKAKKVELQKIDANNN
jgi:hypothetical protein